MLEPDAPFYLTVDHFKSSVQGRQNDCTWFKAQPIGVNKLNSILKDMCEAGGIPRKTNHAGRKTLVQKLQDNDVPPKSDSTDYWPQKPPVNKQLQHAAYENDKCKTFQTFSQARRRRIVKFQMFREERFTYRSAHHLFTTINLQQAHRLRQCMKTNCKRCFMAIQLQEGFSTSTSPRHKVQWVAPNLNLQRKSFAE